jgi:hypothetical protein
MIPQALMEHYIKINPLYICHGSNPSLIILLLYSIIPSLSSIKIFKFTTSAKPAQILHPQPKMYFNVHLECILAFKASLD